MWQGTEKHYHNSSNFRLLFSEWTENQLALARAVDDTAMCQGSSWRRQANHRLLEHSAYSESLWWIHPSPQAGSTGGTVCWEWQGHRTGTGTHHLYPEHKSHPHSCQVSSEYSLQSGQSYLLLFVSFCCIHLYFMFIAMSYQMFFHWCSFIIQIQTTQTHTDTLSQHTNTLSQHTNTYHIHTRTHTHACMQACTHVRMHTCTHTHTHTHTYTHTHTRTYAL